MYVDKTFRSRLVRARTSTSSAGEIISLKHRPKLGPTKISLHSPGEKCKSWDSLKLSRQRTFHLESVISNDTDSLLSRAGACAMQLVMRINAVSIGEVKCTPVKIQLKEDAKPYSVTTARIPIPLLGKAEEELKRMEEGKIIQAVTEPTEWVAPIVPVVRPNAKVRICVDQKKLDQAVRRERYVIPTVDDVIHQLKGHQSSPSSMLPQGSGRFL